MRISNKKLSAFLQSQISKDASLIDKIKIAYRPYICPFSELLEHVPRHSSIFDIGCGSGMFLSLVSEFNSPSSLGGIEISGRLINNALAILKGLDTSIPVSLNVFNGHDIPDEVGNYNYVFLIDVLHHVRENNQLNFLRSIYEKMSPGSKLILKDIDAGNVILSKFNKLHDLLLSGEIGHELRSADVEKALARIGFKTLSIIKTQMFVYPHYTIICEK